MANLTRSEARVLPSWAVFGFLAAVSALLCYLTVQLAPNFLRVGFGFSGEKATILPGIIFGTLVASCNYFFGARGPLQLVLVIALTTVGWIAAVEATIVTAKALSSYENYVGGLVGGAVGGGLTILGVAITNRDFRRFGAWSLSWGTATVAGATLGVLPKDDYGFLILFAVWQIAVIVSIVRGLPPEAAKPIHWRGRGSTG